MRKSSVLLGIACIASALSAGWFWQQMRDARQRADLLQSRLSALEIRQAAAPTSSRIAPTTAHAPASHPPAGAAVPAAQPPAPGVDGVNAWEAHEREMLRDPEYRQSRIEESRQSFAAVRADAIRMLGMTPEQADRVIDLWVEGDLRFQELGGVTAGGRSTEAQAELKRGKDAEQEEVRALLGEEKYQQWQRYVASLGVRPEVTAFRAQLANSAEPLSDRQAEALVWALHTEREQSSNEFEEYRRNNGSTDINTLTLEDRQRWIELQQQAAQRIHDAMTDTLTSTQLASLDKKLGRQQVAEETEYRLQLKGQVAKSP
jgi:hypothetical protein